MELYTFFSGMAMLFSLCALVGVLVHHKWTKIQDDTYLEEEKEPECTCDCEQQSDYSKWFISFVIVKPKGARAYVNEILEVSSSCPSDQDLDRIKSVVLAKNPDYREISILSLTRLEG